MHRCDFNLGTESCGKDSSFEYIRQDGSVRHLCEEHIGDRIMRMEKDIAVTVKRIK